MTYLLPIYLLFACQSKELDRPSPNIIYILADDLGYGEVGVYGQEKIKTPHIDALAETGMRFTQHYSGAPVCAPARCVLLTGKHAGHAYIRGNDEWGSRGEVWDYEKAFYDANLEGQRPIPANTNTIGRQLQSAGYETGIFGKWGLGAPLSEGIPNLQGFDKFYGYNCQRQAHNLYPKHLWNDTLKVVLRNELIAPRTKLEEGADINSDESYKKFTQPDYAPKLIHDQAITFIKDNKDVPFFLFYASPLPHLPLQAPTEWVEKYRNEIGEEEPYVGDKGYFPNRYPKAAYAAMISYLDDQVGDLVATLIDEGLYENTIIIFSSDNGPTYTGGVDFDYFESSKPFANGYGHTKGYVYEGGIRVPMIVNWPGHVVAGSTNEHISVFYDVMPTLCDIVGAPIPEDLDGISFKPTLLNQDQKNHEFLYWEFPSYNGQQAVRLGKWKGVRKDIKDGNLEIELYDLEMDLLESKNLADTQPEIISRIKSIMELEHVPSGNEKFKIAAIDDI